MSGIVGSYLNHRGSGLVAKLGTDAYQLTSQGAGKKAAIEQLATGGIADDAVTLAKMASGTDGNIISFDASGNPVAIATGSDGQVLTSTGAGSPPAFEAAAGGGKIGQIVTAQAMQGSSIATHSTSFVTTGVTAAITPVAVTSKILITVTSGSGQLDTASNHWYNTIYRDATDLGSGDLFFTSRYAVSGLTAPIVYLQWLDSPSSTSEIDYTIYHKTSSGAATGYWCWAGSYYHMALSEVLA